MMQPSLLYETIEIIIRGPKQNYKITAFSVWDHLGPLKCPASDRLTSSTNTFTDTHTLHCDFLRFQLVARTVCSIQTFPLTRWFEFRSGNSWLAACFPLPYTPSCSPFLSLFTSRLLASCLHPLCYPLWLWSSHGRN